MQGIGCSVCRTSGFSLRVRGMSACVGDTENLVRCCCDVLAQLPSYVVSPGNPPSRLDNRRREHVFCTVSHAVLIALQVACLVRLVANTQSDHRGLEVSGREAQETDALGHSLYTGNTS